MDNSERIYEICLGGIGGQGVMLMAKIMGEALSNDGYNVLQTQAHGIEARGGISYGEVLYLSLIHILSMCSTTHAAGAKPDNLADLKCAENPFEPLPPGSTRIQSLMHMPAWGLPGS